MEAIHTEGPWRVERKRHYFQIMHDQRGKGDGYNNRVAETVQWSRATGPQIGPTEAEANARLIAAAPDLLRAAEDMLEAMVRYQMDVDDDPPARHREMMARARAAISKATSRQPEGER